MVKKAKYSYSKQSSITQSWSEIQTLDYSSDSDPQASSLLENVFVKYELSENVLNTN